MMQVECIDDIDRFDELRAFWDTVYAADPHATIFVSWAWLRGWLEVTPYDWLVLAVRPDNTSPFVAFFALSHNHAAHRLQMAGDPWADYTGFVCLPECEEEAIAAFARFVQQQLKWDTFRMRDVFDPRVGLFLKSFSPSKFDVQRVEGIVCPFLTLPDTWEQYLQNFLSSSTRQSLRRKIRRIERHNGFQETQVHTSNLDHQIEAFLTLFQLRWGTKPEHILDRYRTIFRRCFENDSLWLTVFWDGTVPIAGMAAFVDRQRRTFNYYISGWSDEFSKLSPGQVIVAHSLRYAIENDFRVYDFLRGDEPYKYSFGAKKRFNTDVLITRKSLKLTASKLIGRILPPQLRQWGRSIKDSIMH
jgi:CelD/BcsL family acetyltransferase involved in cellulose biosynthesis